MPVERIKPHIILSPPRIFHHPLHLLPIPRNIPLYQPINLHTELPIRLYHWIVALMLDIGQRCEVFQERFKGIRLRLEEPVDAVQLVKDIRDLERKLDLLALDLPVVAGAE